MFTGIVETTGTVQSIAFREGGACFVVQVGPPTGSTVAPKAAASVPVP